MLEKVGYRFQGMDLRNRNFLLNAAVAATFLMGAPAFAEGTVESAFDTIKAMAGQWQGKDDDGQPATVNYEVSSGGTIVIEKLSPGAHPCMTTVYHRDKDSLMMTHYCNMDNQPRMRLKSFDPAKGTLAFNFVDITNLKSERDGYIKDLTISMPDKEHLVQDWTFLMNGKESHAIFKFERKANDVKTGSTDSTTRSGTSGKAVSEKHDECSSDCCSATAK